MDILAPIQNKKIDEAFGKGSIFIPADECIIVLGKTKYNGIDHCITMQVANVNSVSDVRPNMPKCEINNLIEEVENEMDDHFYITQPMCHRTERNAWESAAKMLRAAADAAQAQADKLPTSKED